MEEILKMGGLEEIQEPKPDFFDGKDDLEFWSRWPSGGNQFLYLQRFE